MGNSKNNTVAGYNPWDFPTRSPGSLGINDAADPDTPMFFLGNTSGSLGVNDCASPMAPPSIDGVVPSRAFVMKTAAVFLVKEEMCPLHPYWPKSEHSGITWGVGWDASQQNENTLQEDWGELPKADLARLKTVLGKENTGERARLLLPSVVQVMIPEEVSLRVFKEKTLPKYYRTTMTAFPGANLLPRLVQIALISLVYNRGGRMKDTNTQIHDRQEMRAIREAVQKSDLVRISVELRKMERLWVGKKIEKGMKKRRESEAELVEIAIKRCSNYPPPILDIGAIA